MGGKGGGERKDGRGRGEGTGDREEEEWKRNGRERRG